MAYRTLRDVFGDDTGISFDKCPEADLSITELWNRDGVFVILEAASGQYFTNQTHGMLCYHPLMQGLLIELGALNIPHVGCWGGLKASDCAAIQAVVQPFGIDVDVERAVSDVELYEAGDGGHVYAEAWVPIRWGSARGVLTYGNCD